MQFTFDRVINTPIADKTLDGKSYREIEPELIKPLPAEWHEIKKLGFSKDLGCNTYYGFCPWWRLRQRLRQLVGSSGWRFEIVQSYPSSDGDPIVIGILNILGIEHQGIGYGRSHNSYKGGKEEIAYADAFKNAAEQHGLGAYLDDQKELVRYLLAAKHPEAKAIADVLKVQFIKSNALTQSDVRKALNARQSSEDATAKHNPPKKTDEGSEEPVFPTILPNPQPDKAGHTNYNGNGNTSKGSTVKPKVVIERNQSAANQQIEKIMSRIGATRDRVLELTNGVEPAKLHLHEYNNLIQDILLDWAVKERFYGDNREVAQEALDNDYKCFCAEQQRDLSMVQAAHLWIDHLQESLKS